MRLLSDFFDCLEQGSAETDKVDEPFSPGLGGPFSSGGPALAFFSEGLSVTLGGVRSLRAPGFANVASFFIWHRTQPSGWQKVFYLLDLPLRRGFPTLVEVRSEKRGGAP